MKDKITQLETEVEHLTNIVISLQALKSNGTGHDGDLDTYSAFLWVRRNLLVNVKTFYEVGGVLSETVSHMPTWFYFFKQDTEVELVQLSERDVPMWFAFRNRQAVVNFFMRKRERFKTQLNDFEFFNGEIYFKRDLYFNDEAGTYVYAHERVKPAPVEELCASAF